MNFIKKMFPFISAAAGLGGPLGAMAANVVGKALGVDKVDPSQQGIADAITRSGGTAEQIAAMQKAEQDFQLQMQQLGFQHAEEIEKIEGEDRASARSREAQVKDKTPRNLAYLLVGSSVALCWYVISGKSPALHDVTAATLAGTVLGYVISEAKQVCSYYFGSSEGSSEKNAIIAGMAK